MIGGYVFWLVMARITTPEVIGTSSSVISLATIFTAIVTMGIPTGLPKLLGKNFAEDNLGEAKTFVRASFALVAIAIAICSGVVLISQNFIHEVFKMDSKFSVLLVLLMTSSTTTQLLRSVVTSTLRTKIFPISMAIATSVKLGFAIMLILIGLGALGVTLGYIFFEIVISVLSAIIIFMIFRKPVKSEIRLIRTSKEIIKVSVVSWIPILLYNMGSQLGTLVVLGTHGAGQAGIFFVAFAIYTAIAGIMNSLTTIAFPVLSSMSDGRKNFASRVMKMSLVITLPLSFALTFYSKDIMGLFGSGFLIGSFTLEILLFAILPTGMLSGINILMYSYGKYKQVLYLGLASNISRTVFYFILVPTYGSEGAAVSFLVGSIISFVISIFSARRVKFLIFWKDLSFLFFVPLILSFVLHYLNIHVIIGIIVTLIVSYAIFLKTKIVSRTDLKDTLESLPNSVSGPVLKVFDAVNKRFSRS